MQDYREFAEKNGFELFETGKCQCCGANTKEGIKECVELFQEGFDHIIDYAKPENYRYKFLSVDAHTLQHAEIHGRWNNHLHLSRLHLVLHYNVSWTHRLTPKLSQVLGKHKEFHQDEYLSPPPAGERGEVNIVQVTDGAKTEERCKEMIARWARGVYDSWCTHHPKVDQIAEQFFK